MFTCILKNLNPKDCREEPKVLCTTTFYSYSSCLCTLQLKDVLNFWKQPNFQLVYKLAFVQLFRYPPAVRENNCKSGVKFLFVILTGVADCTFNRGCFHVFTC